MADKVISLKLSEELYNKMAEKAKEKELATSAMIRMILKEYADREDKKDK